MASASPLPPHCAPENELLEQLSGFLGTCIPTPLAAASTLSGAISIASWLCAQMPQIWKNYKRKSVDGLSLGFLSIWLAGDICNLLGAIWTDQMWFQQVVGAYYVFVDCVLVGQFAYFGQCKTLLIVDTPGYSPDQPGSDAGAYSDNSGDDDDDSSSCKYKSRHGSARSARSFASTMIVVVSLMLHMAGAAPTAPAPPASVSMIAAAQYPSTLVMIGGVLSWASTFLYLTSRLPQIFLNMRRKTTSGLSITLFVAAFFGNFFYSASLLLNPLGYYDYPPYGDGGLADDSGNDHVEWWSRTLPFFLGAAGVLALDATVGFQYLIWGEQQEIPEHEQRWAWEEIGDSWSATGCWGGEWWPWGGWWNRESEREELVRGEMSESTYGTVRSIGNERR